MADLNSLSKELHEKIKKHTFAPMRALFLSHIVTGPSPKTLAEASSVLSAFPNRPNDPSDAAIESHNDVRLVPLLKALKRTTINKLRNQIVHKRAYRPTREQVEEALEETRSILFPLTTRLELYDEINWYMKT